MSKKIRVKTWKVVTQVSINSGNNLYMRYQILDVNPGNYLYLRLETVCVNWESSLYLRQQTQT